MAHVATVTIDSTLVDSDLTDFPVYVDLSDLPSVGFWDTVANGGGDIRVFLSDDSTELPREVVSCDTATETGELHFLLDYLSSSSDTDIHIYADGTSSDYATGATYGRDAVWADYARVYHLRESSGSTATDSSGNADGTYNGTLPAPLGVGQDFNGSSDYVDAGNGALGIASGFTFSAMIAPDSVASGVKHICTYDDSVDPNRDRMFQFRIESDELRIIRFDSSNGVLANQVSTTSPVSVGNNHVAFTFDTTNGSVGYVDAVSVATDSSTTANRDSGAYANLTVGARDSGAGITEYFDGDIGFLRVRSSGVSADWVSTEYSNQSSPSTFYSASAAGGGGVTGSFAEALGGISLSSSGDVTVSGTNTSTLEGISLSSAGEVLVEGSYASTLSGITLSADGAIGAVATGDADISLGGIAVTGSGAVDVAGDAALSLGGVGLASAGEVLATGQYSVSLEDVQLAADGGGVTSLGSASIEFAGITLSSAGEVDVSGAFANTLEGVGTSGSGGVLVQGSASSQLDGIAVDGNAATTEIICDLSVTLSGFSVNAAGVAYFPTSSSSARPQFKQLDWAREVRKADGRGPHYYDQYRFSGRTFRKRDK